MRSLNQRSSGILVALGASFLMALATVTTLAKIERDRFDPDIDQQLSGIVVSKKTSETEPNGKLHLLEIRSSSGKTLWQCVPENEYNSKTEGDPYP